MDRKNIDNLFRDAAAKPAKEFPQEAKVWSRLEDRLDKRHLGRSKRIWQKLAIAASFLLCASLGFQLWQDQIDEVPSHIRPDQKISNTQRNEVDSKIDADSVITVTSAESEDRIVNKNLEAPSARPNVDNVNGFVTPNSSAEISEVVSSAIPTAEEKAEAEKFEETPNSTTRNESQRSVSAKSNGMRRTSFNASDGYNDISLKSSKKDALIVLDDVAITAETDTEYDLKKKLMMPAGIEIDSIIHLKEPLYIINGIEYSEYELFGPKPTSPYAPLLKQNVEKIKIYQDSEAIKKFGPKGKKGVVVIKTKNAQPLKN